MLELAFEVDRPLLEIAPPLDWTDPILSDFLHALDLRSFYFCCIFEVTFCDIGCGGRDSKAVLLFVASLLFFFEISLVRSPFAG